MNRNLTRRARLTREIPRAPREKHRTKICPFCPFVLNDLVLSLLSLECPFRPVLCPFRPVFCPFCPSNKGLKLAETVLFLLSSQTVNMTKRVCRDCPNPNCGASNIVKQQQIQFPSGSLCMKTMKGRTQRRELSYPACSTSSLSH